MLATCSHLFRKCRLTDLLPHQLAGLALQSVGANLSTERIIVEACDDASTRMRIVATAAASTSSPSVDWQRQGSAWPSATFFGSAVFISRQASTASLNDLARRREILREAAQKVPADSSWLLAYSSTLQPRQLTYRLGKRETLSALAEGWALYQQKFDTVAMAALLRRIRAAQLRDPSFDPAAAQRLIDAMEPRVRAVSLRFGRLRDITAYLHALAKLQSPPPTAPRGVAGALPYPEPLHPASTEGMTHSGQQAQQQQQHSAVLSQPSELVLDLAAFATRNRVEMLHASPQRLATLLWALMRLLPPASYGSEKLQVVLDRVALCSILRLQNFAPLDMRIYGLAYATFGPRSDAAAAAATSSQGAGPGPGYRGDWPQLPKKGSGAAAEAEAAGSGQGQRKGASGGGADIAARRLSRNVSVLKALADELAARSGNLAFPQPEPRDLALAAHALALQGGWGAGAPHLELLTKASAAAAAALPRLQATEVVQLVEALAAMGVRQPALMDTVRKAAATWGNSGGAEAAKEERVRLQARLAAAYERLGSSL